MVKGYPAGSVASVGNAVMPERVAVTDADDSRT